MIGTYRLHTPRAVPALSAEANPPEAQVIGSRACLPRQTFLLLFSFRLGAEEREALLLVPSQSSPEPKRVINRRNFTHDLASIHMPARTGRHGL